MCLSHAEIATSQCRLQLDDVGQQIVEAVKAGRLSPLIARLDYFPHEASRVVRRVSGNVERHTWSIEFGRWDVSRVSDREEVSDARYFCPLHVRIARIPTNGPTVLEINGMDARMHTSGLELVADYSHVHTRANAAFMSIGHADWFDTGRFRTDMTISVVDAAMTTWLRDNVLAHVDQQSAPFQPHPG